MAFTVCSNEQPLWKGVKANARVSVYHWALSDSIGVLKATQNAVVGDFSFSKCDTMETSAYLLQTIYYFVRTY